MKFASHVLAIAAVLSVTSAASAQTYTRHKWHPATPAVITPATNPVIAPTLGDIPLIDQTSAPATRDVVGSDGVTSTNNQLGCIVGPGASEGLKTESPAAQSVTPGKSSDAKAGTNKSKQASKNAQKPPKKPPVHKHKKKHPKK